MSGSGRLTEQQVFLIGRSLLEELARLHAVGGVSGVVGPATVLVDASGAAHLAPGGGFDQAYASPEVLTGQPPTPRSDLYSAGALLAHLFRGSATLPPRADDLDPGIGWLLGPVLSPDPATRPDSAAAMVHALDQLAEQRHGREWRVAASVVGVVGAGGAVPLLVLATGGSAAAAGGAGAGAAAGLAGAAGIGGAGGVAGSGAAGAGVVGGVAGSGAAGAGVGGVAGSAAGGAGGLAGGTGQAAAGGLGASQGGAVGAGVAAPGTGGPAAGGGIAHGTGVGISKGVVLKVGAVVAAGGVGVAGAAVAVVALTGGETQEVDLPATANIYLAGADDDVAAQLSAPGTKPVAVKVDGAGKVSFPSVEGELGACAGCEPESPDGGSISFGSTGVTGFNGIAGVTFADRTLFVVGVFVGDKPPAQPADAVVDLSGADDEVTQEPELGEPFFVGDGETGDGEQQEVVVPDGAKTLYLGFADAYGFYGTPGAYEDNSGSVDIEVTVD